MSNVRRRAGRAINNAAESLEKRGKDKVQVLVRRVNLVAKLGRYCSAACQKRDWKNHKNYCHVVKVYPVKFLTDFPEGTLEDTDYLTGKVKTHQI